MCDMFCVFVWISASSPPSSPSSPIKNQNVHEPTIKPRHPTPDDIEPVAELLTSQSNSNGVSIELNSSSDTEPAYQNMGINNTTDDNNKKSAQIVEQNSLNANTSSKSITGANVDNAKSMVDSEYANGNIENSSLAEKKNSGKIKSIEYYRTKKIWICILCNSIIRKFIIYFFNDFWGYSGFSYYLFINSKKLSYSI